MKFPNRVREFRNLRRMTIQELAQLIDEPYSTVQKIDAGSVDLSTWWLEKLSKAFNVKPYELLRKEWQPEELSNDEKEILSMIRKTKSSDNTNSENTKIG